MSNKQFIVAPSGSLQGRIRVPGDKSISHRSVMLGALAEGTTKVSGFLEGEDSFATIDAFRAMGVKISDPLKGEVSIVGVGVDGLQAPEKPMDMGNSGTSMRLLAGILAGQDFTSELVGDASLTKRPMDRVIDPLGLMGCKIESDSGRPPLKIRGSKNLRAIDYSLPMASAQVKSCILLAGLFAEGETRVVEPAPTRDHTERMLRGFGYQVESEKLDSEATQITLVGRGVAKQDSGLTATNIDVPADISSAAFFMVAASIVPGSDLVLEHVGINPTRTGVIDVLKLMGADLELFNKKEVGGEPVADIRVKYAKLKGIKIPEELVALAIDEFPVLFVAASAAEGETVLTGAEELRVKESDRIQVMADALTALGIDATPTQDGMIVKGGKQSPQSAKIYVHHDHRIAMAAAVAGMVAADQVTIENCEIVDTSFPGFVSLLQGVGVDIQEKVVS